MTFRLLFMLAAAGVTLAADVVVLRDGSSYTGQLQTNTRGEIIAFTGDNGVGFTFPIRDIQSLVFTANADIVTLRSGRTYTGHYNGRPAFHFAGAEGISYDFPVRDVASIVFSDAPHRYRSAPETPSVGNAPVSTAAKVIPEGTEIRSLPMSVSTQRRRKAENSTLQLSPPTFRTAAGGSRFQMEHPQN